MAAIAVSAWAWYEPSREKRLMLSLAALSFIRAARVMLMMCLLLVLREAA